MCVLEVCSHVRSRIFFGMYMYTDSEPHSLRRIDAYASLVKVVGNSWDWERRSEAEKIVLFIHGNTASESEFDQDNGLRYRKKNRKRPIIFFTMARNFYRSHYRPTLKLHANRCAYVKSKRMDSIVRIKCGDSGLNPYIVRTDIQNV